MVAASLSTYVSKLSSTSYLYFATNFPKKRITYPAPTGNNEYLMYRGNKEVNAFLKISSPFVPPPPHLSQLVCEMCTILTSLGVFLLSYAACLRKLTGHGGGGTKEDDSKKSAVHAYLHGVGLLADLAMPQD